MTDFYPLQKEKKDRTFFYISFSVRILILLLNWRNPFTNGKKKTDDTSAKFRESRNYFLHQFLSYFLNN